MKYFTCWTCVACGRSTTELHPIGWLIRSKKVLGSKKLDVIVYCDRCFVVHELERVRTDIDRGVFVIHDDYEYHAIWSEGSYKIERAKFLCEFEQVQAFWTFEELVDAMRKVEGLYKWGHS